MEVSGAILRRSPSLSGARALRDSGSTALAGSSTAGFGRRTRVSGPPCGVPSGGGRGAFSGVGHLKYYASPVRCGEGRRKKEEKTRAKLVKGLSKDLAALCTLGIGADPGEGLAREVKGKMISEAAELLLAELNQLRAQEKETKRKRREAKAARRKGYESCNAVEVLKISKPTSVAAPECKPQTPVSECCSRGGTAVVEKPMNKIEVCMGGKCRRSGAPALMEELNKKIGLEGAVVGCKCMGKCRDGPNLRVLDRSSTNASTNPLCIGVGFDDVATIVANFFGENDEGLVAA
ncbi:hypothetical protein OPV22_008860 [Ensete ventricosum]|uniref:Diacylglycerol O-acyltransferase 3, cytosolic n=1 Tax=Ensete ventricosum TaxID=4639 RepID=A0AAV8R3W6_ENSVE|nr:hypothetical protein OPV22_008860 [Ensete ventricosum]